MNLIKSELRKFFSTRTWIWLLVGCVGLALLQVVIFLLAAGSSDPATGMPLFPPIDSPQIVTLVLSAPASATIFIAVLGVLGMTTEYRYKTISPTFLATPHRWKVLLAKLVTYLVLGVLYAFVAAVCTVVVAAIWVNSAGGSFSLGGDNAKVLVGAAVAAALYGVIGVSVGALIPNQIGALSGLLAYMFVIESILAAVPATQDSVYRYLPGGASAALYTYTDVPGQSTEYLTPSGGGLVLLGYVIVLAGLAYIFSTRREVS